MRMCSRVEMGYSRAVISDRPPEYSHVRFAPSVPAVQRLIVPRLPHRLASPSHGPDPPPPVPVRLLPPPAVAVRSVGGSGPTVAERRGDGAEAAARPPAGNHCPSVMSELRAFTDRRRDPRRRLSDFSQFTSGFRVVGTENALRSPQRGVGCPRALSRFDLPDWLGEIHGRDSCAMPAVPRHTFRPSRGGWLRLFAAVFRFHPVRCKHCMMRVWRFV